MTISLAGLTIFLTSNFLGIIPAILIGVLVYYFWGRINRKAATIGLFESNINAYYTGIKSGLTHSEAISLVIESRYPHSPDKQKQILDHYEESVSGLAIVYSEHSPDLINPKSGRLTNAEELKFLVYLLFCQENGDPPEGYDKVVRENIAITYERIANKYAT